MRNIMIFFLEEVNSYVDHRFNSSFNRTPKKD